MSEFTLADFNAYFKACHNVEQPFDWQRELVSRVLEHGWPEVIDLPTAAGKTAVIDIALFALAAQASLPPADRTAPRRIALVVDRRVVADGAYERAQKICTALENATDGILKRIRDALLAYGGETGRKKTPLQTALLRGGILKDESWARTPLQPSVLVSTVDQIGSRLLHRGYGLSVKTRPIHAGLLANDTLIILDEAHLSRPFEDTLGFISRYRKWAEEPLNAPFAVVRMSATHAGETKDVFPPTPDIVFNDARLNKRLQAPKLVRCEKAKDKKDATFAATCVSHASEYAASHATVAVIVNRVSSARSIFEGLDKLTKTSKKPLLADVILLTGRSRPIERDKLLEDHKNRILAGRDRTTIADQKPLIVVATQCVEAGADFDFDAMVTELCPLDCLRQRLGRLNRIGDLPEAHATVIARADIADGKDDDPVYGSAPNATWKWLCEQGAEQTPLNMSAAALPQYLKDDVSSLLAPSPCGPLIFPAYCNLWVQTNPEAIPTPDPAVFLHGPERGEPDVYLVWRADLPVDKTNPEDSWQKIISFCPPVTGETLSISLSTARKWLSTATDDGEETDTEGCLGGQKPEAQNSKAAKARTFLIWRGEEHSETSSNPKDIHPGDTIIIPASYGGCDKFGWHPNSNAPVDDVFAAAYGNTGRTKVFRIHPDIKFCKDEHQSNAVFDAILAIPTDADDAEKQVIAILREHNFLHSTKTHVATPYPGEIKAWAVCPKHQWSEQTYDLGSDRTDNVTEVLLSAHNAQVASLSRHYAERCGLPPVVQEAFKHAGEAHDWGKADPRFQTILCGSRIDALKRKEPLAKSIPLSKSSRAKAEKASGYPPNTRHELLSVRLLEKLPAQPPETDLVKHLIESHHGRARPFVPAPDTTTSIQVSLTLDGITLTSSSETQLDRPDSGVADRFWQLTRRFGWWGLSYLEAIFRLADHRASENPDGDHA